MTLFLLTPFFINTPIRAAIVINELMPLDKNPDVEWVELYNTDDGPDSKSLNGWMLQNAEGDKFPFGINAKIPPHGFLTLTGYQMNMRFSIRGDTVQLFDEKTPSTLIDSQSYPSTLGYDNSMGRSVDGGGTWVTCTTATFNTNNDCPQPSPTANPTPFPTKIPTPTLTPQPKADWPLADTPAQRTFGSFLPSPAETQVLGTAITPSPTPTPDPTSLTLKMDKILAYQILAVAVAWGIIAGVAYVRRKS